MKQSLALKLLRSKYGDVSNEDLVKLIAEDLNVELSSDPVNKIHELTDRSDKCYVWDLDATDQQTIELTRKVRDGMIKKYGRDPKALHIIRNDVSDVSELSPEEVRSRVEPWLNEVE